MRCGSKSDWSKAKHPVRILIPNQWILVAPASWPTMTAGKLGIFSLPIESYKLFESARAKEHNMYRRQYTVLAFEERKGHQGNFIWEPDRYDRRGAYEPARLVVRRMPRFSTLYLQTNCGYLELDGFDTYKPQPGDIIEVLSAFGIPVLVTCRGERHPNFAAITLGLAGVGGLICILINVKRKN